MLALLVVAAPSLALHPTPHPVAIDGLTQESAWTEAAVARGFTEQQPRAGAPAAEATTVYVTVGKDALYIAAELESSVAPVSRLGPRDRALPGAWLHVELDTFGDQRSSYRFSVNPAGVQQDARTTSGRADMGFDAVWPAEVERRARGWSVEMAIPFRALRFRNDGGSWGFQVTREHEDGSVSRWSPTPQNAAEPVRHFGRLDGVRPRGGHPVVLRPTLTTRFDSGFEAAAGFDGQIALLEGVSLDVTVLPDFGQVEADPSQLNLGATELFLAERRPFFAESGEYLGFFTGLNRDPRAGTLFYSRRVGGTSIAEAVRLSGKSGPWTMGAFQALTLAQDDTPVTHYVSANVGRALMDQQLNVNVAATHVHRLSEVRVRDALTIGSSATFVRKGWLLEGRVFASRVSGSVEAMDSVMRSGVRFFQRPDASHVSLEERTSLGGFGATTILGQLEHPHVRGAVGGYVYSPGLELNDLGFLPRVDEQLGFAWLQLRRDGGSVIRSMGVNFNANAGRTFGGEFLGAYVNANGWLMSDDQHQLNASVSYQSSRLDPSALFGGPALYRAPESSARIELRSNPSEALSGALVVSGALGRELRAGELRLEARWRPLSSLELSCAPSVAHRRGRQFLSDDAGYEVAMLTRNTAQFSLRADWTISRDLSFQLYAAPYLSAGRYLSSATVGTSQASDDTLRYRPRPTPSQDILRFDQVRANALLRWMYAPGSTLTLAWSHEQTRTEGQASLRASDFGRLFAQASEDRIILKVAHRIEL